MVQKAHTVRGSIGIFAFDDDGNLIMYKLFSSFKDFLKEKLDLEDYKIVEDELAKKFYREKMRELALGLKFDNEEKLNEYLTRFGIDYTKYKMKHNASKDSILVQAVRTYEDLQSEINVMAEHFYEWVIPYYPEINADPIKSVRLFHQYRKRENIPDFSYTTGIDLNDDDLKIIDDYADSIYDSIQTLGKIESYIKKLTSEIAPNMSNIVGPLIAAKLISKAGSLKNIASMSSSSIQLLGAEKALFRYLKSRKRTLPPKYGIIFFSSYIQRAPKSIHGKLARIISSKLSIAAKIDYYSNRFDKELKEKFEREISEAMK